MDWLWFGVGVAAGLLVFWLIYLLVLRPGWRKVAVDLRTRCDGAQQELSALKTQLAECQQDAQTRLDAANVEIGSLKEQSAQLDARLSADAMNAEIEKLRAELTSAKTVQTRLDAANAEVSALKKQVAALKETQTCLASTTIELDTVKARLASMLDSQERLDAAKVELSALKGQVAACGAQATQHRLEVERLSAELAAAKGVAAKSRKKDQASVLTGAQGASVDVFPAAAQPVEPDDLTVIEGIGPKIEALLHENGIDTFAQLAATSEERLRSVLRSAGSRFGPADPGTWPQQALLAGAGQWDALKALQATLKRGRAV